jgi:8-oxo-dGTP pyrophosphatase MutT (NUDIX family)
MIWYKFSSSLYRNSSYKKHRKIFVSHDHKTVVDMIKKSTSGDLLWEIPKGRANKGESPLDTCVRELEEELSIKKPEYNIIFGIPVQHNLVSEFNINYYSEYYIAEYKSDRVLYFGDHQNSEVCGSKWWSIEELQYIDNENIKKLASSIITLYGEFKEMKHD